MVSQKVVIESKAGIHLKPAGQLCKLAVQFPCSVRLNAGNVSANAKSVLSVLSTCLGCGDEVEVVCEGEQEAEALEAVTTFIRDILASAEAWED